jgi:hypothetical protein
MSLTKVSSAVLNIDDLYGFRNRFINGDMRIDQRNAGASVAIAGTDIYTVDRWKASVQGSGTGRFSVQGSTVAPAGFTNSTLITVTTADAAPSASFGYQFLQSVEGFNTADFGFGSSDATAVTVSFWVRSSVTGTLPVLITNGGLTRSYGATYTVNSANTWEYKTITIPGDVSGAWETNNGVGLHLQFGLGGGSARTAATGWQTTDTTFRTTVTGSTQLIATSGATFYITGVQLEKGTVATPFERRPFGTELALCQRYYYKVSGGIFGYGYAPTPTTGRVNVFFPVTLRTAPTALEQTGTAADYNGRYAGSNANLSVVPAFNVANKNSGSVFITVASGFTTGDGIELRPTSSESVYLAWSAEL